tara:strand:+ start:6227 stop:6397 length:171 start_codon:yes stop_codon:yes gene_type:complete
MKASKAIRKALEKPWLYRDEELKKLEGALKEIEREREMDVWIRRTRHGFSNEPKPE